MIATTPCHLLAPESSTSDYSRGLAPSHGEIRRLLHRLGQHVSLLETIAAAPCPLSRRPECLEGDLGTLAC